MLMDQEGSARLEILLWFPLFGKLSRSEEAACRLVSVHGFDHVPLSLEVAGNPRERFPITTMLAVVAIKA